MSGCAGGDIPRAAAEAPPPPNRNRPTLMVQDVLADDEWSAVLTDADRRGLTPLFWTHVALYGEVKLDMSSRLALSSPGTARA